MRITATEFKNKLGGYLNMACKEDIIITKNGKDIAILSKPTNKKLEAFRSLVGTIDIPFLSKKQMREKAAEMMVKKYERGIRHKRDN